MGAFNPSEIDDAGMTPAQFRIYFRIVRRSGDGYCYETIQKMADGCKMSKPTVISALKWLVENGFILRSGSVRHSKYSLPIGKESASKEGLGSDSSVKNLPPIGKKSTLSESEKANPSVKNLPYNGKESTLCGKESTPQQDSIGKESTPIGKEYTSIGKKSTPKGNTNKVIPIREYHTPPPPKGELCSFLELIWNLTPPMGRNRSSKVELKKAWEQIKPKPEKKDVIDGLKAWADSDDWKKDDGKYVPSISRFVKNRKWESPPIKIQKQIPTPPKNDIYSKQNENVELKMGETEVDF